MASRIYNAQCSTLCVLTVNGENTETGRTCTHRWKRAKKTSDSRHYWDLLLIGGSKMNEHPMKLWEWRKSRKNTFLLHNKGALHTHWEEMEWNFLIKFLKCAHNKNWCLVWTHLIQLLFITNFEIKWTFKVSEVFRIIIIHRIGWWRREARTRE